MWVQVWLGYSQSLRPTLSGLTLNIDMAATAFLEVQPVTRYLQTKMGLNDPSYLGRLDARQLRIANKAIAGIKASLQASAREKTWYTDPSLLTISPIFAPVSESSRAAPFCQPIHDLKAMKMATLQHQCL